MARFLLNIRTYNKTGRMKAMKKIIAASILLLTAVYPAQATVINGGFESGDFWGWEVSVPYEHDSFFGPLAAGSANVIAGNRFGDSPTEGTYAAAFGTGDLPQEIQTSGLVHIYAQQTLTVEANQILSGDAFFYNGDYMSQDSGWVRIYDEFGNEIGNPWIEYSGSDPVAHRNSVAYYATSDWTHWEWRADTDGPITLSIGVSSTGDNMFDSYAGFDNIQVASVPEPTTFSLTLLSVLISGFYMRRKIRP